MKNFYYLLAFLMISLITSCSDNSVNTSAPEPIPMPKNFYRLDTKTPFDDKYDLQGLKSGLNTYVDKYGGWCRKEEFGEDFSIWIEDLSRVMKTETEWEVSFKLTVAQPSATTKKGIFKEKRVRIRYEIPADVESYKESFDKYFGLLTKALKLTAKYGDYDPKIKTFAISGYELLSFMNDCKKEFSDNNITNARKAEALICGQTIGELLKLWFVNYENKNNWN